tara:strand:- start:112 stop:1293 length:1182 start_codon:yes stop_codon:yes gene_type:complete
MSVYIGKDTTNTNIIHMTTDEQSLSTLAGDPTATTILHSKYKPFNVISDSTYSIGTLSVGYSSGYLVENHISVSSADAALIEAGHMWLPYFIQDGVTSTSQPINQYAVFGGVYHRSATFGSPIVASVSINIASYGVHKSAGVHYVPPESYTIGLLIFNHKYEDSLTVAGGPVLLKNDSISVGSAFDLSTDKFFCYNQNKLSVSGDKVIISSVTGEPSYNYKNFSGTQTSNYEVTLNNNLIKRNINGTLTDFIGGSGGRMILPYEKRSWTRAQLEAFMNLTYTTTTSTMSNSNCAGYSYVIFVWKADRTLYGTNWVYQSNGIFYPISSSSPSHFRYQRNNNGNLLGIVETNITMVCSANLSQINLTLTRTPYSQTSSNIDVLRDVTGLDAYFIK